MIVIIGRIKINAYACCLYIVMIIHTTKIATMQYPMQGNLYATGWLTQLWYLRLEVNCVIDAGSEFRNCSHFHPLSHFDIWTSTSHHPQQDSPLCLSRGVRNCWQWGPAWIMQQIHLSQNTNEHHPFLCLLSPPLQTDATSDSWCRAARGGAIW